MRHFCKRCGSPVLVNGECSESEQHGVGFFEAMRRAHPLKIGDLVEGNPCSSRCSTLDGKWSISTNEEEYHGVFDSMEDAIAEGKASKYGSFYVGRCVSPVQPEVLFTVDAIEDWLERHVWSHDEYSHDWAEGHVCPTSDEMAELADEIRPLIAAWLDRCKLRPTFWNIDPASVRKIDA